MAEKKFFCEVTWKLENFSYNGCRATEYLTSTCFNKFDYINHRYNLLFYPKGKIAANDGKMCIQLQADSFHIRVSELEFALMDYTNSPQFIKRHKVVASNVNVYSLGFDDFVDQKVIFENKDKFLPQDVLTIRCRFRREKINEFILLRSIFHARQYKFVWNISNFSSVMSNNNNTVTFSCCLANIELNISISYMNHNSKERIGFEVDDIASSQTPWFFQLKLLFSGTQISYVLENEIIDNGRCKLKKWDFAPMLSRARILEREELITQSDMLSFDCELTIASRKQTHFANDMFRESLLFAFKFGDIKQTYSTHDLIKKPASVKTLKQDIKQMQKDCFLHDFTLKVQSETIPVHMAILGSRSPVFRCMIESEMKEKLERTIFIEDLDVDTTKKMLDYFYTDNVGELNEETARLLYYAGDKYQVEGLKNLCSYFLKHNLSVDNVCSIAEFAELHQDLDLKTHVLNYISHREKQVLSSEGWQSFKKRNKACAGDLTYELCRMKW